MNKTENSSNHCPACKVAYAAHLGLTGVCEELTDLRARIATLVERLRLDAKQLRGKSGVFGAIADELEGMSKA